MEELVLQAKLGSLKAKEQILINIEHMIYHQLHKEKYPKQTFLEISQDAKLNILTTCLEKFDPKRGNKFTTFAFWYIKNAKTKKHKTFLKNIKITQAVKENDIKEEKESNENEIINNEYSIELIKELNKILHSLPNREKQILTLLYIKKKTKKQIANKFKLTETRIDQIKENAIKKMQHPCRKKMLSRFENSF